MSVAATIASRMHAKPAGDGWLARCPAHDDDRASLSIGMGQDDRALLHCHAGCSIDAVLGAAGLTYADLQPAAETAPARSIVERRE